MATDARWMQQAEGFLELDLPSNAIEALEKVSADGRTQFPHIFHTLFAEALRSLSRFEDAIGHFIQARHAVPTDVGCYLALGWCYKRCDRIDLAIESLAEAERICRMSKKHVDQLPLVLYNLSCYYALAEQRKPMLDRLAAALDLNPDLRDLIPTETDFDAFRDDPQFQKLATSRQV